MTLPAGAGGPHAFAARPLWHDRIRALAPHLIAGPAYRPAALAALAALKAMDAAVRDGYTAAAYDHLAAAERAARERP